MSSTSLWPAFPPAASGSPKRSPTPCPSCVPRARRMSTGPRSPSMARWPHRKETCMAVTENDVLEEIRDQLESIKVPGAKDATPDNTWSELDVDSLDLVELVKALEDRFGVTISDDDLKPIESVGDAMSLTIRLVEAKEGAPA